MALLSTFIHPLPSSFGIGMNTALLCVIRRLTKASVDIGIVIILYPSLLSLIPPSPPRFIAHAMAWAKAPCLVWFYSTTTQAPCQAAVKCDARHRKSVMCVTVSRPPWHADCMDGMKQGWLQSRRPRGLGTGRRGGRWGLGTGEGMGGGGGCSHIIRHALLGVS